MWLFLWAQDPLPPKNPCTRHCRCPRYPTDKDFFSLISIAHVLYLDDAGQDGSLNDLTHKELLHLKGKAKAADTKEYKISFCSCKRPFFTQLLWRSFEKIKKYLPDVDMKGCFKVFFYDITVRIHLVPARYLPDTGTVWLQKRSRLFSNRKLATRIFSKPPDIRFFK